MSRTYKDKPYKIRHPSWRVFGEYINYSWIDYPGVKTKKRKKVDTEDHWMTTPSWWNNLFHSRPIRGKFRNFCELARKTSVEELEEMVEPMDSHKPHKYYY